jgi:hypothetical protein
VVEEPALGAPEEVFDLFAADALFRWAVGVGLARFHFDNVDNVGFAGNYIHFVAAMTPVPVEDVKAIGGQPVSGQLFSFLTGSDMWHHPCNLLK